tara:strand:+ start:76 stop:459 length:384 start_codon:yes stop_codon:yes gene_type:complete
MYKVKLQPHESPANHSMSAKEVVALSIQEVVAPADWQVVRKSLRGLWVNDPKINVHALIGYLEINDWNPLSCRQVKNILTGSVFRTHKVTKDDGMCNELRGAVRRAWHEHLNEKYDPFDPRFSEGVL